jgi:hypothetical protein
MPPSAFVLINANAVSICSKLNSWVVIDEGSTRPFSMRRRGSTLSPIYGIIYMLSTRLMV